MDKVVRYVYDRNVNGRLVTGFLSCPFQVLLTTLGTKNEPLSVTCKSFTVNACTVGFVGLATRLHATAAAALSKGVLSV